MRLPRFDFREPSVVEEALSLLEEFKGSVIPLAGGTDLIPIMKYGLETPSTVVGLKRVSALRGISLNSGNVHIGAMTLLVDMLSSRTLLDNFPGLIQAVKAVAAPPLWNVATIGGNICQNSRCLYYNQSKTWRLERPACFKAKGDVCHAVPAGRKCFSVYSSDLAPALTALGATITIRRKGQSRTIPLQDLFSGNGLSPFTMEKSELLTGVEIPLPQKRSNSSYIKKRMRSAVDYPLISASASIVCNEDNRIKQIRLVLGAVGSKPVIVGSADQIFAGKTIDEIDFDALGDNVRKETRMVDNLMLPGSYRRQMLPVIARDAVRAAFPSIVE